MKILIISDLHLGPCFKKQKEVLDILSKPWDKIIVNGDLYELLGFQNKEEIEKEYKDIFEILNKPNVIKLEGNHDLGQGALDYFFTLPNGKKVAVTHGHKYDDKTSSSQVKLNIIFFNIFGIELRRIFKCLKSYEECEKKIIEEYKTKSDYLIIGHSHQVWKKENVYNIGDWIEHSSYLIVEDNNFYLVKGSQ